MIKHITRLKKYLTDYNIKALLVKPDEELTQQDIDTLKRMIKYRKREFGL